MRVNALVVDLALLGAGAWDFLERVSAALPGLGIVVCTGRSSVSQRVRGLRLGADDWVTKPCHPEEVLARVEAVVRRRKRASARVESGPLVAGDLEIRADQFQAFCRGQSVDLTRREFEVLQLLAQAEGKVLQREEIYQAVWGYAMAHGDRSVDVFIRKVRQKLERRRRPGATSTPISASATASTPSSARKAPASLRSSRRPTGSRTSSRSRRCVPRSVVVPHEVVHPGLLGGWGVERHSVPRRTGMQLHANARICPKSRALIASRVLEHGWSLAAAAEAAGVSERTAGKWVRRFRSEGVGGLRDRSSAPRRLPTRVPAERVEAIRAAHVAADGG